MTEGSPVKGSGEASQGVAVEPLGGLGKQSGEGALRYQFRRWSKTNSGTDDARVSSNGPVGSGAYSHSREPRVGA
jgi:hypothetical protein